MKFLCKCDLVLPGPQLVRGGTVMEFDESPGHHWEALDAPVEPERPRRGRPPTVVSE